MPSTKSSTPEPPAAAVARDPHWAAKLDRLRARRLATVKLRMWEDPAMQEAFGEQQRATARMELLAAGSPDDEELQQAAKQARADLQVAEQAADRVCEVLEFRALPGDGFEELVKAHPPTEAQAEDGDEWNRDTFVPALIAAAAVDPMSEDDVRELLAVWGPVDRADLFQAAWDVQQQRRTDLGKG